MISQVSEGVMSGFYQIPCMYTACLCRNETGLKKINLDKGLQRDFIFEIFWAVILRPFTAFSLLVILQNRHDASTYKNVVTVIDLDSSYTFGT